MLNNSRDKRRKDMTTSVNRSICRARYRKKERRVLVYILGGVSVWRSTPHYNERHREGERTRSIIIIPSTFIEVEQLSYKSLSPSIKFLLSQQPFIVIFIFLGKLVHHTSRNMLTSYYLLLTNVIYAPLRINVQVKIIIAWNVILS